MAPVKKPRSPRSPEASVDAVRIFPRGQLGWFAADFRRWGRGRVTLRDPEAPGWPAGGERTQDRETARRWADEYIDLFREEARRRQRRLGAVPRRLGDAVPQYIERRQTQGVPTNTWQNNRSALNHLLRFAAEDRTTGQRGEDLRTDVAGTVPFLQRLFDTLEREGYRPNTLLAVRNGISGFLHWLETGQLPERKRGKTGGVRPNNAAHKVVFTEPIHEEVAPWDEEQLAAIRDSADEWDRTAEDFRHHRRAVELALGCGGRRNELFALRWPQLSREAYTARITHQLHKERRELVPLKGKKAHTALLMPWWWEHHQEGERGFVLPDLRGDAVYPRLLARIIKRVLESAGVHEEGRGWHTFRHTYARDFIVAGGRFEELQKSLGHQSIVTTQDLYGHFHEDQAAALARSRIYREGPVRAVR